MQKAYICLSQFCDMKTRLFFFISLVALFAVACEKDKFTTKPQVKVKSLSPGTANRGDIISLQTSFTDEEGDIDSVYYIVKWYDGNIVTTPNTIDTVRNFFDDLSTPPKTREGDLFIKFSYGLQITGYQQWTNAPTVKDTTVAIGIVLIDKQKNRSDYAESEKIRLTKQ